MTAATEAALSSQAGAAAELALVCDKDLGDSAAALPPLVESPAGSRPRGRRLQAPRRRWFGVALRAARWAIRNRSGFEAAAPISGQRAIGAEVLRAVSRSPPDTGWRSG